MMRKKHILCLGDSNTHGRCADPAEGSDPAFQPYRFKEDERWTCLLQQALGDEYLVLEEGLNGRTTVFSDPLLEDMAAIDYIRPCMKSHQPIDLLIVMLGTNDVKARFCVTPPEVALGMERLLQHAAATDAWASAPNILLIAPAPIGAGVYQTPMASIMGSGCAEKSEALATEYQLLTETHGFAFLDAGKHCTVSSADFIHLTKQSHAELAKAVSAAVQSMPVFHGTSEK